VIHHEKLIQVAVPAVDATVEIFYTKVLAMISSVEITKAEGKQRQGYT
jgi:hypothetical protein